MWSLLPPQYFTMLSISKFHVLGTSHRGSNSIGAPIVVFDNTGKILKEAKFCTSPPNSLKYEMEDF
jgi:hypothetical protein